MMQQCRQAGLGWVVTFEPRCAGGREIHCGLSGERVFRTEEIVKALEQKRYCDQGSRDGKSKGQWEVVRGEKS